ncbi:MAG: RagB/SusD family nutrient uptake outer membrane protein, partial [Prolixibacteraceae bacterium]|nr:RagB/SusD family nutrient uptake outer membrane protein [Prolixibacteraceae bacterium]
ATDYGHATKWAAKSLLARVFLFYTGYHGKSDLVGIVSKAKALEYVEDVVANSGYALVAKFSDLWPAAATHAAAKAGKPISQATYAGENNEEVIFSIKYSYLSNYDENTDGNHWLIMNGLRGMSWAASGYGNGWGACPVPAEVYSGWNKNDERRDASIMAITEEKINYTKINDCKEYTGYMTKKYTPQCDSAGNSTTVALGAVNFMIGQYQDYFVIRFADVLLMAAELGSAKALEYVNRVRQRAGLSDVASVDKDIIYAERKYEFAFEGIRYFDLLRYDSSLQYAANAISYSGKVKTGGSEVDKVIDGNNVIATRGLCQVPYNQITATGGVVSQNAGW